MKICYINLLITKNLIKEMEDYNYQKGLYENFLFNFKNEIQDIDDEHCYLELSQSDDILESEDYINLINFLEEVDEDLFRIVVKNDEYIIHEDGQLDMEETVGILNYDISINITDEEDEPKHTTLSARMIF